MTGTPGPLERPLAGAGPAWAGVVATRRELADGVVEFVIEREDGAELTAGWEPGSHIDLVFGPGYVRQYSLCGEPSDTHQLRIAVLREHTGRGGSQYLHDQVMAGDRVEIRGPRNRFKLVDAPAYLFIAGGIGVTPLIPMVDAVARTDRPFSFVYGGRSRTSMAYLEEVTLLAGDYVQVLPEDEHGLLPLQRLIEEAAAGTLVYCCGPERLIDTVETLMSQRPDLELRTERFRAQDQNEDRVERSFEVECAVSGKVLTVPIGRSILDVLDDEGIVVDSSCREGTCATCEIGVLAGTPDHRDGVLTEQERAENTTMMVCVSRSLGDRLVLDI